MRAITLGVALEHARAPLELGDRLLDALAVADLQHARARGEDVRPADAGRALRGRAHPPVRGPRVADDHLARHVDRPGAHVGRDRVGARTRRKHEHAGHEAGEQGRRWRRAEEGRFKRRAPTQHSRRGRSCTTTPRTTDNNAVMDEHWMRIALAEARLALEHDDVPVGAVVVHQGEVVGAGHNERERRQDPTAHAETLALQRAVAAARELAPARHGALRDARAVRHVRRRDRARARAARGLRHGRPEGGRGRQRARRARRAAPEPPARRPGRRAGRGMRRAADRLLRRAPRPDRPLPSRCALERWQSG